MILQQLALLYDRLPGLPPFGFARQSISWCIVLTPDGRLAGVDPLRRSEGKRSFPRDLEVPHPGGKRTAGIKPYFLWDKTDYVLGRNLVKEAEGKPVAELHQAFRQLHEKLRPHISHPHFDAVCTFLRTWQPDTAETVIPLWSEVSGTNLVFRIEGEEKYLHELPAGREAWATHLANEAEGAVTCLVTGRLSPSAEVHPPIKGVEDPGGTADKGLFNFNKDAFESYGKKKGANAPVSEAVAFKYTTALNHLLRHGGQKRALGDTTTVFWTEKPTPVEDLVASFFGGEPSRHAPQDETLLNRLGTFLTVLRDGGGPAALRSLGEPDPYTRYFLLGLAPNSSRLSVRFWHIATLGSIAAHLKAHYEALRLERSFPDREPEFPAIWELLRQTGREAENIPPLLGGALLRSILAGGPYPQAFATAVLRRIRADREITYLRCAALKAWLTRNTINATPNAPKPMLDESNSKPAYRIGRLFAVLERVQEVARKEQTGSWPDKTIRDAYFSAACSSPRSVFQRLIQLSVHHERLLQPPAKYHFNVLKQKILTNPDGSPWGTFDAHHTLEQQGMFVLGYYQQRHVLFPGKAEAETSAA
jgi:CRISPR-associated protein Csd1